MSNVLRDSDVLALAEFSTSGHERVDLLRRVALRYGEDLFVAAEELLRSRHPLSCVGMELLSFCLPRNRREAFRQLAWTVLHVDNFNAGCKSVLDACHFLCSLSEWNDLCVPAVVAGFYQVPRSHGFGILTDYDWRRMLQFALGNGDINLQRWCAFLCSEVGQPAAVQLEELLCSDDSIVRLCAGEGIVRLYPNRRPLDSDELTVWVGAERRAPGRFAHWGEPFEVDLASSCSFQAEMSETHTYARVILLLDRSLGMDRRLLCAARCVRGSREYATQEVFARHVAAGLEDRNELCDEDVNEVYQVLHWLLGSGFEDIAADASAAIQVLVGRQNPPADDAV